MLDWNWETNTWTCPDEMCAYERNHALANFCAMCGAPVERKPTDVVAPIPLGEPAPERPLNLLMNRVDRLFNVFGEVLLVDRSQGAMQAFPEPMSDIRSFSLPEIPRADIPERSIASRPETHRRTGESLDPFLRQVDFDRWWIYALRGDGHLYLFPVSALGSEDMAISTPWRPGSSSVRAFVCEDDHLFLLDQERRTIHVYKVGEQGYRNQWEDTGDLLTPIRESLAIPFFVEEMVPIHGNRPMVGLIGESDMALLSDEGIAHHDQSFRKEGLSQWVGTLRGDSPRVAAVTDDQSLEIRVCYPDGGKILVDQVGTQIHVVRPLQVESEYWFAAISLSHVQLFDPLDREMKHRWPCPGGVSMEHMELMSSFGDVLAGFQRPMDRTKPTQFCLIQFHEQGARAVRSWNLPSREVPVVPPAGFGRYVYLIIRDRRSNHLRMLCYDLQKT